MQYFKHFGTMRHDIKIKRVISKYGLEGYGLYNLTLESITESLSTSSPLPDLQETCEDIAEFYNGNTAKINEMMNYMINQGLFDLDDISGRVMCNKLYKFLDTSQTRSPELRAMIKGFKAVSAPQIEDMSNTVSDSQGQSQNVCAKYERKEEEKNKNKEEEKNKEGDKSPKRKRFSPDLSFIDNDDWRELYQEWVDNKKSPFKKQIGVNKGYTELLNLSDENIVTAQKIIDKSLANNWSGLFELKGSDIKKINQVETTEEELDELWK